MGNIIESNRLIAEFMGAENPYHKGHFTSPDGKAHTPETMKYHISWDWLMPVVEKIEGLSGSMSVYIYKDGCQIEGRFNGYNKTERAKTKIEATYKAVVEFIKWYNANK